MNKQAQKHACLLVITHTHKHTYMHLDIHKSFGELEGVEMK